MKVEIISKELIKPLSPTPNHLKIYKLSYIDLFIPPSYVPLLVYYSNGEATSNINQSNMSSRLKNSLSQTLVHFYPLAGRLTQDQGFINCGDQGVSYTQAHVDSRLSDIINNPNNHIEDLSQFIPCKLTGTGVQIVEEQLAIQVNLFPCGGIVIGMCFSHRIADGFSFSTFIKAWGNNNMAKKDGSFTICPVFNSASVFPPPELQDYWPKPRKPAAEAGQPPQPREKLVTKRFVFTASKIAALKAKVVSQVINPTRVEVLSALIWKCGIAIAGVKKTMAFHVVNLRGRMPPLEEQSFGNFFQMVGTSMVTVTNEEADLGCLVEKLRAAFREIDGEYTREMVGENRLEIVSNNLRRMGNMMRQGDVDVFNFSSWCRFPCYEADFGWGKPSWMSSVNFLNRNAVIFFDSEGGGIQVWITLNEEGMVKFEQLPELQSFISIGS